MSRPDIPIILTGTIIPNALNTAHSDPAVRRKEYLDAINYYSGFSNVVFLENSSYRLEDDPEFSRLTGVQICKMPVSLAFEKGKGYQEFEMIDNWIESQSSLPERWIKITGRYIYNNFAEIYQECLDNSGSRMMIDLCARSRKARTYLFCVETDFYLERISGAYRDCSDDDGRWIEDVIYNRLCNGSPSDTTLFSTDPDLSAVSGSTGDIFESGPLKKSTRRMLRRLNRLFDKRFLWYTR